MIHLFQNAVFFDLFEQMAAYVVASAEQLRDLAGTFPANHAIVDRIHQQERETDQLTHRVTECLTRAFLPPIDREDVHALAEQLDDIVDAIDAAAQRFRDYHIDSLDEGFMKQANVLARAGVAVHDALRQFRVSRRFSDLSPFLAEIHALENEGDAEHYAALSRLFGGGYDPLYVLKWQELHELVEAAIDATEDVANILESITLKA